MTLYLISENNLPTYMALSTDIADGKIDGAILVGKTVYLTDTATWKIIEKDLNLSDYAYPAIFSV